MIPSVPFEYRFADDEYEKKFAAEQRVGNVAGVFSVLAILISCLGLFGMAMYVAEQRTREIGVRKVLGASVAGITALLSRDFLQLVMVSFLLAAPLAWWGMYTWLRNYPYRVEIQWWVFALAGILSAAIAVLTVSWQAIRAAMANPSKSLRSQ